MDSKYLWTTVFLLSVFALEFSNARMSNWNSLSFGPDFEKQWAFDENKIGASDFNERPIKPSVRIPMADEKSGGKMNRKNCFMSPVQCSFYFKRSMQVRSDRYI